MPQQFSSETSINRVSGVETISISVIGSTQDVYTELQRLVAQINPEPLEADNLKAVPDGADDTEALQAAIDASSPYRVERPTMAARALWRGDAMSRDARGDVSQHRILELLDALEYAEYMVSSKEQDYRLATAQLTSMDRLVQELREREDHAIRARNAVEEELLKRTNRYENLRGVITEAMVMWDQKSGHGEQTLNSDITDRLTGILKAYPSILKK